MKGGTGIHRYFNRNIGWIGFQYHFGETVLCHLVDGRGALSKKVPKWVNSFFLHFCFPRVILGVSKVL